MLDTVIAPVTPEKVTTLKPSEAIRLGCLIAPVQAFGYLGVGNEACAMGAMYLLAPAHLNDTHQWTREAIADWLEGQGL